MASYDKQRSPAQPRPGCAGLSLALPSKTCYLLKCPPEIIMMISEALGANLRSRGAFSRTCRIIHSAVEDRIYRDDVRYHGAQAMYWAISSGRLATLKNSVARGADIFRGLELTPFLHEAAGNGYDDVVKYLLDQGVSVHHKREFIYCNCWRQYGSWRGAGGWPNEFLVIPGQRRQAAAKDALHVAICTGHPSTARILMDHGALEDSSHPLVPRQLAIRTAAAYGQHELFDRILLGREADKQVIIGTTPRPPGGGTRHQDIRDFGALHFALGKTSNVETIDALVNLGADVNEPPHHGTDAGVTVGFSVGGRKLNLLDRALKARRLPVIAALLRHGARPSLDSIETHLFSALQRAVHSVDLCYDFLSLQQRQDKAEEYIKLARVLIAAGADFHQAYSRIAQERENRINPSGLQSSMMSCCEIDAAPLLISFFLEMGVTTGEINKCGKTALAVLSGFFKTRMWHGLEYRRRTSNQLYVWERERRLFAAVESLLQHGASPMVPVKRHSPTTIIEQVVADFPRMDDTYNGFKAARTGINAVKLARLFLKHATSLDLPPHTIGALRTQIRGAIDVMRRNPPVTDLSPGKRTWYLRFGLEDELEDETEEPLKDYKSDEEDSDSDEDDFPHEDECDCGIDHYNPVKDDQDTDGDEESSEETEETEDSDEEPEDSDDEDYVPDDEYDDEDD
ncbi:Ankyrin repeat-containing domain protein [Naviculisporaceae sp. PSN 640]